MAADDTPNGKTLRALVWGAAAVAAIVTAAFALDGRYASANPVPTREDLAVTNGRVSALKESLREMRGDIKEILRRLPR